MSAEGMKAMCWVAMYALAFTLAPLNHAVIAPDAAPASQSQTQAQA